MPTVTEQLLSRTIYATDGTTTNWDFSFSGGYLLKAHVKAYTEAPSGARTEIIVTDGMFTGPYQLNISPALATGLLLGIYRDTPKDLPLVDFTDESGFSEISLDTNAKQAVFIAAEAIDIINTSSSYDAVQAAEAAASSADAAAASALATANSALSAAASALLATTAPVAAPTVAATAKVTPVDADLIPLVDSATSFTLKKLTWANLKTALTSLFATKGPLTSSGITGAAASGTNSDITSLSSHPVGKMIGQIQTFQTGAVATGTGNIPHDNTTPQNTEGDQFMSLSITPQNASSTLEIDVVMVLASSIANPMIAALFQDATVNSLAATDTTFNLAGSAQVVVIKHIMTAGTTSATTFKVRAGTAVGSGATTTLNGSAGAQLMGGVSASRITIKEYLP